MGNEELGLWSMEFRAQWNGKSKMYMARQAYLAGLRGAIHEGQCSIRMTHARVQRRQDRTR